MSKTLEQRFWEKVDLSGECWLWTAAVDKHTGYGRFRVGDHTVLPHRFSYELVRSIPAGLQLDHRYTCPRLCVRPDHLRPATNKQNNENKFGCNRDNRSSGIRGVSWDKVNQKWEAKAKHNGKTYHAGRWSTTEEAEAAVVALRNQLFTHNDMDRLGV